MAYFEIPLTSDPDQVFSCKIPVDNANLTLNFRVRYNTQGNYWWATISDKDNIVLIDALPLLPGKYPADNILASYSYLNIGSAYLVNTGNTTMDSPDSTNMGTDFKLIWGDTVVN